MRINQCISGWGRRWHPTPVLLPGKSDGQRSLVGYSPWGCWVGHNWATLLSLSLPCIGEGNGNPLQCSCLNPRDEGVSWAAVYGVAQSWTRLKRLSCSSSCSGWGNALKSFQMTQYDSFKKSQVFHESQRVTTALEIHVEWWNEMLVKFQLVYGISWDLDKQ